MSVFPQRGHTASPPISAHIVLLRYQYRSLAVSVRLNLWTPHPQRAGLRVGQLNQLNKLKQLQQRMRHAHVARIWHDPSPITAPGSKSAHPVPLISDKPSHNGTV